MKTKPSSPGMHPAKKVPIIILAIVLILPSALILSMQFNNSNNEVTVDNGVVSGVKDAKSYAVSKGYTVPEDALVANKIKLITDKGDIVINLFPEDAPLTVMNFVTLGKRGYYNGDIFHRIIRDFVIQTGDPEGTGNGGESIYKTGFDTEKNLHFYSPGTLGMARASDRKTNGSQFFITTDTISREGISALDGNYTAFGQIEPDSLKVVQAIASVETDSSNDRPKNPPKVTGFEILN